MSRLICASRRFIGECGKVSDRLADDLISTSFWRRLSDNLRFGDKRRLAVNKALRKSFQQPNEHFDARMLHEPATHCRGERDAALRGATGLFRAKALSRL
jgi:hypothetical protein